MSIGDFSRIDFSFWVLFYEVLKKVSKKPAAEIVT